jgi:Carboxypeptidase regulatory-like domain/TonB dependent receptor
MRNFILRIALIYCLIPASYALAQGSVAGSMTGVVVDPQGASISGAVVTVSGPAMLTPKSEKSVAGGVYLIENLPPGEYRLTCALPGFKGFEENGIVLTAGFTATVNISLAIGDTSETVTVMGSATPVVDVESSTTPVTFDSTLLANTPSGNDPWSTLAQTPGVTVSTFDVGGNNSYQQSSMSVHGSKTTETVYAFNGLDLNGTSQSNTFFYVDQYSYDEVQMVTGASPPEIPIGGAYMNMITRQGSNSIHGFVLFNYEDDKTQAQIKPPYYTPIASVAALGAVAGPVLTDGSPFIRAYDSAVDLGAPIIKDKWWIFGAFREYQLKQQLRASPLPNPVTGAPPSSPLTNPGQYGFGTDVNHQTNTTLRNDYQINSKNVVNAVWHWQYINRFFRRSTSYSYVDQDASYVQIEPAYIVQGQEIFSPTAHLTIDSRIGFLGGVYPERYQPGVAPQTIPAIDIGASTLKYAGLENYINKQKSARVASTASYFHGGWKGLHNFKAGVDISLQRNYSLYNYNQDIFEEYNTLSATSAPNSTPFEVLVQNGPIDYNDWSRGWSIFLQDAWTINRHLTLNIGGRFDASHAWIPPQCNKLEGVTLYSALFPNRCTSDFQKAYAAQAAAGEALGPLTPYNNVNTYDNIVPRISIAYDPSGRGNQVIRGGFNMFTNNIGTSLADSTNPNGTAVASYGWNGTTIAGSAVPGAINSATPDYTQFAPACVLSTGADVAPGTAGCLPGGTHGFAGAGGTTGVGGWISTTGGFASYVDPHIKRPYSVMYNAEYERALFRNISVSAAYYYRNNRNIQTTANINGTIGDYVPVTTYQTGKNAGQPILNPLTGAPITLYNLSGSTKTCLLGPLYTARSTTDVGCSYTETTNNPLANTNHYNGLEFTVARRLVGRWSALVGVTFQSDKGTATSGDFNDPNQNINRFGSIDQDVPFVVRADVTYRLPLKLQASVNYQHETGYPIQLTNTFSGLAQGSESVKIEPNGYQRYPSINDTNLRVGRVTPFGERFKLETDCDLFNVFNAAPTTAETVAYGSTFLKPTVFLGPFVARFQAKLSF